MKLKLWYDKRCDLFYVRGRIHEKSKQCLNFTLCLFKPVHGTISFKYNEQGRKCDWCLCHMKPCRAFNLVFGWIWDRKWIHWENWIPVAEFDNCPLAKCYCSILDWSMFVWRCHRRKPTWKLAGFAQRILCSQYHTVMQKWNKYCSL